MTRRLLSALVLLAGATVAGFASENRIVTVRVPFAFKAGSELMPAGEYVISSSDQNVLFLRTPGKSVAVLPVGASALTYGKSNALRFERRDGSAILTEISIEGGQGFVLRH